MNEEQRTQNEEQVAPGAGFSMIEILTVVVILAILLGMLFPVVIGARTWAREKRAMMEIKNIEMAVKSYRAVYGQWPRQTQGAFDTTYYADNAAVIGALTTNNSRGMVFLQLQQSSLSNGSFLDPWLHPYVIVMDENSDNLVTFNTGNVVLTNLSGNVTTNSLFFSVDGNVGVVSWGKLNENLIGSANMDLCSWQSGAKTK